MTFTYSGTLVTPLDQIRFSIQDTVSGSGIKPQGGNFTDEEINGLYAIEGTVGRTVAALYEALATLYGNYVDTKIGPRDEKLSQKANAFLAMAKEKRAQFGYAGGGIRTGFVTRVDGYSEDIDSGET